jgi:hypothetical protein
MLSTLDNSFLTDYCQTLNKLSIPETKSKYYVV